MSSKVFLSCTDTLGRNVILEEDQYHNHIIAQSGHLEIKEDPMCIEKTVKHPDKIYVSSTNTSRDVYFAKGAHKGFSDEYVKVIVDFSDAKTGFIVTAFTISEVRGNIGVLKYEKTTTI